MSVFYWFDGENFSVHVKKACVLMSVPFVDIMLIGLHGFHHRVAQVL